MYFALVRNRVGGFLFETRVRLTGKAFPAHSRQSEAKTAACESVFRSRSGRHFLMFDSIGGDPSWAFRATKND
jgi:hypothetical protein